MACSSAPALLDNHHVVCFKAGNCGVDCQPYLHVLQLRDFYGPLLACVTATKSAYDAMVSIADGYTVLVPMPGGIMTT